MKIGLKTCTDEAIIGELPDGEDGVAGTIAAMQAAIDDALTDPRNRNLIRAAMRRMSIGGIDLDRPRFVLKLFSAMKTWFKFERDPLGVELLRCPCYLSARVVAGAPRIGADCDDLAMLGCAMLAMRGFRPVLVTVGRREHGRFEHVLFGIDYPGTPYYLDPQEAKGAGDLPRGVERVRVWKCNPDAPKGKA